jgi:hypothetical protein
VSKVSVSFESGCLPEAGSATMFREEDAGFKMDCARGPWKDDLRVVQITMDATERIPQIFRVYSRVSRATPFLRHSTLGFRH